MIHALVIIYNTGCRVICKNAIYICAVYKNVINDHSSI